MSEEVRNAPRGHLAPLPRPPIAPCAPWRAAPGSCRGSAARASRPSLYEYDEFMEVINVRATIGRAEVPLLRDLRSSRSGKPSHRTNTHTHSALFSREGHLISSSIQDPFVSLYRYTSTVVFVFRFLLRHFLLLILYVYSYNIYLLLPGLRLEIY